MKIFTASWFFPPATSSEGIVTYKLLRNSENSFDVFSSESRQWGYKTAMSLNGESNIRSFTIDTDDIDEWVDWCVREFTSRNELEHYDAIMTRSTPPESILVGKKIKEQCPDIKWIASFADPVANNPYELRAYIDDNGQMTETDKKLLKIALKDGDEEALKAADKRPEEGVRLLCKLKRWEDYALKNADLIISPTAVQLRYLLGNRPWNEKMFALPHSFEPDFYPDCPNEKENDRIVLTFIGYSDSRRSLHPVISAVNLLREETPEVLEKLEIRIIGNNPRDLQDRVLNYYLDDCVHFFSGVDYYTSLERMEASDWLIHIDAYFWELPTGGSIFFAGKLADYMGAGKPILAITGKGSPAWKMISRYGGACFEAQDTRDLADMLVKISEGYTPDIDQEYRASYSARNVAALFDRRVSSLVSREFKMKRKIWPKEYGSQENKLLTVCVPAYNVEKYLDRCLYTLIDHDMSPYMEVLVIDDGSADHTAQIGHEYERRYPGVVRVISKENGGHGSTINTAVQEAKGLYFRTVDGDDWVDSYQLSDLLHSILDGKITSDVVSSNYHEINIETAQMTPIMQGGDIAFGKEYTFGELDPDETYLTLASMQIRTEILRKMHIKLQEHTYYVDVELILFPIPYINTMVFTKHFIYKYARGNAEQSVAIPNMVKRYDHHYRVMKRVLLYRSKREMSKEQAAYYDAILKRLLCTHYFLALAYDDDKERGCQRAEQFDRELKHIRPDLAEWAGGKLIVLRAARQCGFDPKRMDHSLLLLAKKSGEKALGDLNRAGKAVLTSDITKKMIYNPVAISVAQSDFFMHGKGKALKDKVNKMFGY